MAKVTTTVCDHCGARLDGSEDFMGWPFDLFTLGDLKEVDLCIRCAKEFDKMVYRFVNKQYVEEDE